MIIPDSTEKFCQSLRQNLETYKSQEYRATSWDKIPMTTHMVGILCRRWMGEAPSDIQRKLTLLYLLWVVCFLLNWNNSDKQIFSAPDVSL